MFFSKVSGKVFPEIFEKSIDKHKIDAILNAPSFADGPDGLSGGRMYEPEDSTEESGCNHPDTRIPARMAGSFYALMCMEGNGRRSLRPWFGGVL